MHCVPMLHTHQPTYIINHRVPGYTDFRRIFSPFICLFAYLPHCRTVEMHHQPLWRIECNRIGLFDSLQPRSILRADEWAASICGVHMQPQIVLNTHIANLCNLLAIRKDHEQHTAAAAAARKCLIREKNVKTQTRHSIKRVRKRIWNPKN